MQQVMRLLRKSVQPTEFFLTASKRKSKK
ncbi:MAG: hypothetical protein RL368_254, partial [Pseudomonadota bacterium]